MKRKTLLLACGLVVSAALLAPAGGAAQGVRGQDTARAKNPVRTGTTRVGAAVKGDSPTAVGKQEEDGHGGKVGAAVKGDSRTAVGKQEEDGHGGRSKAEETKAQKAKSNKPRG